MLKTISKKIKKVDPKKEESVDEETEVAEPLTAKKKIIEIDEPEPGVALTEEKVSDEDAPPSEDGEETSSEEAALDDDEVDPFGDKWEQ